MPTLNEQRNSLLHFLRYATTSNCSKNIFGLPPFFSATHLLTPTGPKSSAKNRVRFNLLSFKGKLLQQTAGECFIRAGRVRRNSALAYVGEDLRFWVSPQHSGKRRLPV